MPAVVLQVVSLLVGEIILCIKEVNKKTRVAAYELLVSLAKAMHEDDPPTLNLPVDDSMGKSLPEPPPQRSIARALLRFQIPEPNAYGVAFSLLTSPLESGQQRY